MLGFVTGLAAEARLLRKLPVKIAIGGGSAQGAVAAAESLISQNAIGLISFGLAGGLAPALPPGTIIIPNAVISDDVHYDCDAELLKLLGGGTHSLLLAGFNIAASVTEKAALYRTTNAVALDLESGAVAAVAAKHGLPFAVLRTIADPAGRDLPEAALLALDAQGRIALRPILRSLFRRPSQILQLIELARDAATARKALMARLTLIRAAWPDSSNTSGPHE